MREVLSFVRAQDAYFLLGLSAMVLLLLICNLSLSRRLTKSTRASRTNRIAEGHIGDIAQCLTDHSDALSNIDTKLDSIVAKQAELAAELDHCVKRVGIVRFNAFDDVGGEQSFALALLNAKRDGVVVSSLYGRQDARLYAKSIVKGEGERPLSDEERRAVDKA